MELLSEYSNYFHTKSSTVDGWQSLKYASVDKDE